MRISAVPSFWFVGFSGHRHVSDPEKVLAALSGELRKLHGQAPAQLVGIASLAIGGDQLFLRACRAEGIPYEVLLPFPAEEFKKGFDGPDWEAALELERTAVASHVGEMKETRQEGYLACGVDTVDLSDVLVVVWNGQAAAGVGGTEQIVEYARKLGKPIVWIHSETFEVKTENFSGNIFEDKITDSMRKYLDPHGEELKEVEPRDAVQRLMRSAGNYARRSAPAVRTLAAVMIFLNLAVTGLGSAGSIVVLWPSVFSTHVQGILNISRFILFVIVFGVAASSVARTRRSNWLTTRYVAEMCRSILATWDLPERTGSAFDSGPAEFAHLNRSLYFLQSLGQKPPATPGGEAVKKYVEDRIDGPHGQLEYYATKSRGLLPWKKLLNLVFGASMVATAAMMVLLLCSPFLSHWTTHKSLIVNVTTQLLSLVPMLATSAVSLIYVYEIQRRLVHNKRMIRLLNQFKAQITAAPTAASLQTDIRRCERALLGEVQDWYYYGLYGK